MTHVFSRAPTRDLPTAVSAEGAWITDADGTRYLDGAGGAIVVNVGHGVRSVIDAIGEQLEGRADVLVAVAARLHHEDHLVHPGLFVAAQELPELGRGPDGAAQAGGLARSHLRPERLLLHGQLDLGGVSVAAPALLELTPHVGDRGLVVAEDVVVTE